MEDNNIDIFSPKQIPEGFAKSDLFHDPKSAIKNLNLENLPRGTKVLDIGSGTGELIELLKSRGFDAKGIDLPRRGLPQKADVAGLSSALPLKDKSFDVVINNWGGVTYPLFQEGLFQNEETQKQGVKAFLTEMKEALRVASKEVHIHPWAVHPFFDTMGLVAMQDGHQHLKFLAIDLKKVFQDMNLNITLGPVGEGESFIQNPRYETLNISLPEKEIDFTPLDNLIETVDSTDKPLFFSTRDLQETNPDLAAAILAVGANQGSIQYYDNEIENLTEGNIYTSFHEHKYRDIRIGLFKRKIDIEKLAKTDPKRAMQILGTHLQAERQKSINQLNNNMQNLERLFSTYYEDLVINSS